MKIKNNFLLRETPGMNVVMPTGEKIKEFKGAVILNDSAVVIYKELLKGVDFETLILAFQKRYNIDYITAKTDTIETLDSFREIGILDE